MSHLKATALRHRSEQRTWYCCAVRKLSSSSGFKFFAVVDAQQMTRQSAIVTPSQSVTTSNAMGTAVVNGNVVTGERNGDV